MITIRAYRVADTLPIKSLFYETVHVINAADYSSAQLDAWAPWDSEYYRWAESLAIKNPFVAECDRVVVGFAELEHSGHIDRFYVHKDYQRRGIGTTLLSAIEVAARDRSVPLLFADASITAKPFFEKKGFAVITEQTVLIRGVELINFCMEKSL